MSSVPSLSFRYLWIVGDSALVLDALNCLRQFHARDREAEFRCAIEAEAWQGSGKVHERGYPKPPIFKQG